MSQTIRYYHEKFPIHEMYEIVQGERGAPGVFGYAVPKTYDYTYHDIEYQFPKEKRQDAMTFAAKRAKEPDPTKYAGDSEEQGKKSWKSIGALFSKAKKDSIIDDAMKLSAKVPGPGKYNTETKDSISKTASLGKFE